MSSTSSSASSDILDELYKAQQALAAVSTSTDLSVIAGAAASYQKFINAVKQSQNDQVKQFCADNIPAFFHLFQSHQEMALDAQLDLCEDKELPIRIHAIKGLEQIGKRSPTHCTRMAELLAQCLLTEDPNELNAVRSSFQALFAVDKQACFLSLLRQIRETEDSPLRSKEFEFFLFQVKRLSAELFVSHELLLALFDDVKALLQNDGVVASLSTEDFGGLLDFAVKAQQKKRVQILKAEKEAFRNANGASPATAAAAATSASASDSSSSAMVEEKTAPKKFNPKENKELNACDAQWKAEVTSILSKFAGLTRKADLGTDASLARWTYAASRAARLRMVDVAPFLAFFFNEIWPATAQANVNALQSSLFFKALSTVTNSVLKLESKHAPQYLTYSYHGLKAFLPKSVDGKAEVSSSLSSSSSLSAAIPYDHVLQLLRLFHHFASLSPDAAKSLVGLFTPTGQPGERAQANEAAARREELVTKLKQVQDSLAAHNTSLQNVIAATRNQLKVKGEKAPDDKTKKELRNKLAAATSSVKTDENIRELIVALIGGKSPIFVSLKGRAVTEDGKKAKNLPQVGKQNAGKGKTKQQNAPTASQPAKRQKTQGGQSQQNQSQSQQQKQQGGGRKRRHGGGGGGRGGDRASSSSSSSSSSSGGNNGQPSKRARTDSSANGNNRGNRRGKSQNQKQGQPSGGGQPRNKQKYLKRSNDMRS